MRETPGLARKCCGMEMADWLVTIWRKRKGIWACRTSWNTRASTIVNTAAKWSMICTVTPDGSREQHHTTHTHDTPTVHPTHDT